MWVLVRPPGKEDTFPFLTAIAKEVFVRYPIALENFHTFLYWIVWSENVTKTFSIFIEINTTVIGRNRY